jgi:fatty acid desaturase
MEPTCGTLGSDSIASLLTNVTLIGTQAISIGLALDQVKFLALVVVVREGSTMLAGILELIARMFLFFQVFILFVVFTSEKRSERSERAVEPKWIIFGKVYDLTPWMSRHPGGALVLQQSMGADCSALFASCHTFSGGRLAKVLTKYYVRDARPSEMDVSSRFTWTDTPAHDEMRRLIQEWFGNRSVKAPAWVLVWYAIWVGVLMIATRRWFMTGELSTAFLLGVAIWYSSVDIVHSGMHFAIFESPRANLIVAYLLGTWSYLPSSWIRQHNLLHHTHTNHDEDPDLHHFHYFDDLVAAWFQRYLGFYPLGGWRLSERTVKQKRYGRWMMLFPIYFFSSGVALSMIEPPILYWTKRCVGSEHRFAFPAWEVLLAWAQYSIVVTTVGAMACWHGALAALLPMFTFGLLFYIFTQVSHANNASNDGMFEDSPEWAVAQVRATRGDYHYDSRIWGALSGGLHLQSVHHVFPCVHWAHYPNLYSLIWKAAGEQRAPKSLGDVVREHFAFVARLND